MSLKPYIGRLVPERLLILLTANYDWIIFDEQRTLEIETQALACELWIDDSSVHRVHPDTPIDEIDARVIRDFEELTRMLERVNRENYQHYIVGDLPNLVHRFENAQTYTELTGYFCDDNLYYYACYASRVEVAQAIAVALERGSAILEYNAHNLHNNTVMVRMTMEAARRRIYLRRCLDLYQGVTMGDIAVPIVRVPPEDRLTIFTMDDTLHGHRWVEQFLTRIQDYEERTLHFLLLETCRLAQRPEPEKHDIVLALILGRHPRVGADSLLCGIDNEILDMICKFAGLSYDDPEQLALSQIRVQLAEVTPVTPESE